MSGGRKTLILCCISLVLIQTAFLSAGNVQAQQKYVISNPRFVVIKFTDTFENTGPGTISRLDVYIALPPNTTAQTVVKLEVSPRPHYFVEDKWCNRFAHYSFENVALGSSLSFTWTVEAKISDISYNIDPEKVGSIGDIPKAIQEKYTVNEEKYKIHSSTVQRAAQEAVGAEENLYYMLLKTHDYVADCLDYKAEPPWDDAATVLERGDGSCSEYTFVFIALCRANGIPARYAGGTFGKEDYYVDKDGHRWAEVYLPNYGWVPVDVTLDDGSSVSHRYFCALRNTHFALTISGGESEYLRWNYRSFHRWRYVGEKPTVKVSRMFEWLPIALAREARDKIDPAQAAIDRAESEGRTEGLDLARDKLMDAWEVYENWRFEEAKRLAEEVEALANQAFKLKASSTIICSAYPKEIMQGESVTVSGSIDPVRSGVTVTLTYKKPDGSTFNRTATTTLDGSFRDTYTPDVIGSWSVRASWEGDGEFEGSTTSVIHFTVTKASTSISIQTSESKITEGDSITVSGSIDPTVSGAGVIITFTKPDASTFTRTVTTGSDSSYSDSLTPTETGSWNVEASWEGDAMHEGSTSQQVKFTVEEKVPIEEEEEEKKGCIIATATYGSELSPEVQFLRGFRDNTVLTTFAGKNFMTVFNAWYYSFSPAVASIIAGNNLLRGFMKIILYPLIGILRLTATTYSLFSFNPELAVVVSGIIVSSLLGVIYFAPIVLILWLIKKVKIPTKILHVQSLIWVINIGCITGAEIIQWSGLMMFSTAMFVLTTVSLTTLASMRYLTEGIQA